MKCGPSWPWEWRCAQWRVAAAVAHNGSQLQGCWRCHIQNQALGQTGLWFANTWCRLSSQYLGLSISGLFLWRSCPHPAFDIHAHGYTFSLPKAATTPCKFSSKHFYHISVSYKFWYEVLSSQGIFLLISSFTHWLLRIYFLISMCLLTFQISFYCGFLVSFYCHWVWYFIRFFSF